VRRARSRPSSAYLLFVAAGSPALGEDGFAPAGFIFAAGVLAFAAAVPAVAFFDAAGAADCKEGAYGLVGGRIRRVVIPVRSTSACPAISCGNGQQRLPTNDVLSPPRMKAVAW
jgi:hypothetical protein